jgi:hypothetical protein
MPLLRSRQPGADASGGLAAAAGRTGSGHGIDGSVRKPVCQDPEPHFGKLHLAQAQSNKAPKGRRDDYRDAGRLARRLLTGELILSFVHDPEQLTWRETGVRQRPLRTGTCPGAKPHRESHLEEMRIKLCGVIGDLPGASGRTRSSWRNWRTNGWNATGKTDRRAAGRADPAPDQHPETASGSSRKDGRGSRVAGPDAGAGVEKARGGCHPPGRRTRIWSRFGAAADRGNRRECGGVFFRR